MGGRFNKPIQVKTSGEVVGPAFAFVETPENIGLDGIQPEVAAALHQIRPHSGSAAGIVDGAAKDRRARPIDGQGAGVMGDRAGFGHD